MRYVVAIALIGLCIASLAAGVIVAGVLLIAPLPLTIGGEPVGFMSGIEEDIRYIAAFMAFSAGIATASAFDWLHQTVARIFDRAELRRFLFVRDEMARATDRVQADAWVERRLQQDDATHLIPMWLASQDPDRHVRRHEIRIIGFGLFCIVAVAAVLLWLATLSVPYVAAAFGEKHGVMFGIGVIFVPVIAFMFWDWRRLGRAVRV